MEANDPMDSTEHAAPALPMERIEPTLPIDRTEPLDAIESRDPSDQSDQRDGPSEDDGTRPIMTGRRLSSLVLPGHGSR
jgi:hypothetical protein